MGLFDEALNMAKNQMGGNGEVPSGDLMEQGMSLLKGKLFG